TKAIQIIKYNYHLVIYTYLFLFCLIISVKERRASLNVQKNLYCPLMFAFLFPFSNTQTYAAELTPIEKAR
ncbi:hypothetical protein SDC49_08615, partial [Lactobacillus sp. R2/2]|nr:hypothetical protein [Lactobacillus sp. R2/2]